jgi:hypothetical protein
VDSSSTTIDRLQGVADRLVDVSRRLLDDAGPRIVGDREVAVALIAVAGRLTDRAADLMCEAWRAQGDHAAADQLAVDLELAAVELEAMLDPRWRSS